MNIDEIVRGAATRLKKRQRGFFREPHPSFFGMRDTFLRAAKTAGQLDALQKVGLLRGKEQVKRMTDIFQKGDFGLPTRDAGQGRVRRGRNPLWGPQAGLGAEDSGARTVPVLHGMIQAYGGV